MTSLTLSRRTVLLGAAAGIGAVTLAACSSPDITRSAVSAPSAAGILPSPHVHAIARDPGDGKVYLATHHGLFRYESTGPVPVGAVIDLMGFTIAGPGRFYASGHPGPGVDLPQPVGLIESTDSGATWQVRSRAGISDFHTLTASTAGVLGFDGALLASRDAQTWTKQQIPAEPRSLAAAPDGSRVLATTAGGVLTSSDHGASWSPLPKAPLLLLTAWADAATVVGVTPDGGLHVSHDRAGTWTASLANIGSGSQALSATSGGGAREILVVAQHGFYRSNDWGATMTPLASL